MKQVSIEIIHKCLNNCLHCSSCSGENCTLKISKNQAMKVVDGLKKLETETINISGGEPFLHEGLLDIVRYIKQAGIDVYIYTSGITLGANGLATSLNKEDLMLLKKYGVKKLIFDIPAVNEDVYNEFMGTVGYYKYAVSSLEHAIDIGISTEIHFVPTRINIEEVDEILKFAKKMNVNQVSFLGLVPHGRARDNKERLFLDAETNACLKKHLSQLNNDMVRIGIPLQLENMDCHCNAGKSKLCIRYDGKVYGCEAFKYIKLYDADGKEVIPDSIYDYSIEDIYYNSKYLNQEKRFIMCQMSYSVNDEKCPVQRKLREMECIENHR